MTAEMRDDGRVPATKADLGAVQDDLGSLRGNFGSLQGDFANFRNEFKEFREEMRDMFRPIRITLAHHAAELADIRGYIKDKLVTRDEFHSRMDAFTGHVQDQDYSSAKNRARLNDHEDRISAIEKRPS